jgi:ATP/maltotriose-dependent transcriptional regulator MalT
VDEPLVVGRRSFEQRAWRDAYRELSAADLVAPLALDDLERLAISAFLAGDDEASDALTTRAYQEALHQGDARRAARCAFWLAFGHLLSGDLAQAGGWVARAQLVLDEGRHDCVERGFLLVPTALGHLVAGELAQALTRFSEALSIGERFADADLITFGRLGRGQALVFSGHRAEGTAEFDLLMVAITSDEVSPMVAGVAYCAVIEACQLSLDLRRAKEWTTALSRWCEAQPDLVPFRGQCLVHRAEIMQLHGAWEQALAEAQRARDELARPPGHPAVGMAWYRMAELRRLRGELARAEEAYRAASDHGHDPQPGLARLRLAQGQAPVAASAIRRAFGEAADPLARARLLLGYVGIMLAVGDVEAARAATDELSIDDSDWRPPALRAIVGHSLGLVRLAEGDARAALLVLRPAWAIWRDLEAPYEAAQVRVATGIACRQLGDDDGAILELHAAAVAFRELGAAADLATVEALSRTSGPPVGGLTAREQQVLSLVATGLTNRSIATELFVSEKTVARHVANIFAKLGVSTRSAATAYAYEHGLAHHA